ncbi:MAG: stage 0 sporulation family protein, partial [Candidatus Ornithospirochaeta sp.]
YNDICLGAWDSVIYPGTPVVYDTKFGLDLGIVVGPAPVSTGGYVPGCTEARGACLHFGSCDEERETVCAENEHQCSSCFGCQHTTEPKKIKVDGDVLWIDHLATPQEMAKYEENSSKEDMALSVCREKILKHNLKMKLITAHFLLGEPKVIFFFTAEERVDFRDLVKDLVAVFRMRIELRQIGVRDESRLIGGLSVCGRDYCCHCMTREMEPVTIKMAKEQNLSLNSAKISGPCGRLLCCLAYEYDYYMEEKAGAPPEGTKLKIDRDIWRVSEVNILSRKLTCVTLDGRQIFIPFDEVYFDGETGYWEVYQDYQDELFSGE